MKIHTIPFHIGDWLGGTLGWDAVECGAYINLIVAHYNYGLDGLPNNPVELAKLAKCSKKIWSRIEGKILQKFSQNGSKIVHLRTILEIQNITRKSSENSANALKRWNSVNASASNSQSDGIAIQNPESINHKPITNNQDKSNNNKKNITKKNTTYADEYTEEFLEFWVAYPPHKGSKYEAFKSYQKARKGKDHETIIRSATAYAEFCAITGQYIANATTWLNGKRWEVDYTTSITPARRPTYGKPIGQGAATEIAIAELVAEQAQADRTAQWPVSSRQ